MNDRVMNPFAAAMIEYKRHLHSGGSRISLTRPESNKSKGLLYMSNAGPGLCPREATYWAEVTAGHRKPDWQSDALSELEHVAGDLVADFLAEALMFVGALVDYEIPLKYPWSNPVWTGRADILVAADALTELVEAWELPPRTLIVADVKTAMGYNLNKHPKPWYIGQVEFYTQSLLDPSYGESTLLEELGFDYAIPVIYQTLRVKQSESALCTWKWEDGQCTVYQYGYEGARIYPTEANADWFNLEAKMNAGIHDMNIWSEYASELGYEKAESHRPDRVGPTPESHGFKCCSDHWLDGRKQAKQKEVGCQFFHTCWGIKNKEMRVFKSGSIQAPEEETEDEELPVLPF